jgi:hypothetical protein
LGTTRDIAVGHGQPYSRSQLQSLLEQSLFRPENWDAALFMPPFGWRRTVRGGTAWERIGHRAWPRLAGVHVVEATKSLYVPATKGKKTRRMVLKPAMVNGVQRHEQPASAPELSKISSQP